MMLPENCIRQHLAGDGGVKRLNTAAATCQPEVEARHRLSNRAIHDGRQGLPHDFISSPLLYLHLGLIFLLLWLFSLTLDICSMSEFQFQ